MKTKNSQLLFLIINILLVGTSCKEKTANNNQDTNAETLKIENNKSKEVWLDRKNGEFHTLIEDGTGKKVSIVFDISDETIDYILKSKEYEGTCKDTNFLSINFEKKVSNDTLALHLMSKLNGSLFIIKDKLKNSASFQIPLEQKGQIYLSEKNVLTFSFYFMVQNDLGNPLIKNVVVEGMEVFILD